MANLNVKDGVGDSKYLKSSGSGTDVDPFIPQHTLGASDNNIGNVDIDSALPAGDNNIGNVDLASSIPAGTNNIGDVDVLTLPTITQLPSSIGQKTKSASLPVTMASDEDALSIAEGTYLGEQVISGNGANQFATLPVGTKLIQIGSEAGAVYCTINGVASVATSGKYIPQDSERWIGPYDNITSLGVFCAVGVKAHLLYEG